MSLPFLVSHSELIQHFSTFDTRGKKPKRLESFSLIFFHFYSLFFLWVSFFLSHPPPFLNSVLNLTLCLFPPLQTILFVFLPHPLSAPHPFCDSPPHSASGLCARFSWLAAQTTCWFGLLICNKNCTCLQAVWCLWSVGWASWEFLWVPLNNEDVFVAG